MCHQIFDLILKNMTQSLGYFEIEITFAEPGISSHDFPSGMYFGKWKGKDGMLGNFKLVKQ
jgi:hypothetical protein